MEFSRDTGSATYRIKSYKPGCITVSGQDYLSPILIMPEKLIAPWNVTSLAALTVEDFEAILKLSPQVVLIGTGFGDPFFLSKDIIQPLTDRGIGVEVMSTASACRTYTVLMSEGRNVAAGLFV